MEPFIASGSSSDQKYARPIYRSLAGLWILSLAQAHGQARGNWPVPHNDAEHSGWQKAETKLSKDTLPGSSSFSGRSNWKKGKDGVAFSEPLLAPRLINAEGFKDLVIWGGKDTLYAVDSELGTMVWQKHFDVPAAKAHAAGARWNSGGTAAHH